MSRQFSVETETGFFNSVLCELICVEETYSRWGFDEGGGRSSDGNCRQREFENRCSSSERLELERVGLRVAESTLKRERREVANEPRRHELRCGCEVFGVVHWISLSMLEEMIRVFRQITDFLLRDCGPLGDLVWVYSGRSYLLVAY